MVANYTYDAWGNVTSVTDANGAEITSPTHIANVNPIRYRGYYYDSETGLYYLQSRYYDPLIKRFISADDASILEDEQENILQHNLFSYCFNNPTIMYDSDGNYAMALAGGGYAVAYAIGGSNIWNPVGWIIVGTTIVVTVGIIYRSSKSSNYNPDPYKRPGQKKQGRENKNGNRKQKGFKPRNNKRNNKPATPKSHTPSKRGHQKYKKR